MELKYLFLIFHSKLNSRQALNNVRESKRQADRQTERLRFKDVGHPLGHESAIPA